MSFLGFGADYEKAGSGISKNAPKKKPFFLFWEMYFGRFWKLINFCKLHIVQQRCKIQPCSTDQNRQLSTLGDVCNRLLCQLHIVRNIKNGYPVAEYQLSGAECPAFLPVLALRLQCPCPCKSAWNPLKPLPRCMPLQVLRLGQSFRRRSALPQQESGFFLFCLHSHTLLNCFSSSCFLITNITGLPCGQCRTCSSA